MALTQQDQDDIKGLLNRNPTVVEESIFDTMWSEHCSYKSSKSVLKQLPTTGSEVALGIGEDSGIIRFAKVDGKQYCIAVSHESHNHPSQVLPIEGAATGVGGVVRDVYCMGADVIGVLNSLHFGDPKKGGSLVTEIAKKVVLGVSDYANPLGVPVLGGETLYHESYNDNCLVNVAALGLIEEKNIIHSYVPKVAQNEPYDVILIGKSTDRTGFGGASFSSATLDNDDKETNVGAVQVHDPFIKRVLVEAMKALFKEINDNQIPVGFKDLGAGGIACASSEIAVSGGFGVEIDLNKVNVMEDGLPPEVISCSETQERFCIAVPRYFSQRVLEIFNDDFEMPNLYPNSGARVIGKVINEQVYRLFYKNETVCNLPIRAITTEVKAHRVSEKRHIERNVTASVDVNIKLEDACLNMVEMLNNTSKRYVYRFFDNAVRGDTVSYPGETDAVVITPIEGSEVGLTVSIDSNLYGKVDPYVSGAAAVAEGIRNVIAVGGLPLAVTDCLNYGNPEKPTVFFDFEEGVRGISDAARHLGFIDDEALPVISGNVSFYNESKNGQAVIPSPVIVVIGKVDDYRNALTFQCHQPDLDLVLVGKRYSEFGGTQLNELCPGLNQVAPQVRLEEEAIQNKVIHQCIQDDLIQACHDISAGGLWQCLIEMALGERGLAKVGLDIDMTGHDSWPFLFSENAGYVCAVKPKEKDKFIECCSSQGVYTAHIGRTISDLNVVLRQSDNVCLDLSIETLNENWNKSSH